MEFGRWGPCIDRLATSPTAAAALLTDAVAILQTRAWHLTVTGRRTWEPAPAMPAVVIVINEYAELADKAPAALGDADFIALRGRAAAVTLVATTLRPAHKALSRGTLQSQMDTRIWFGAASQYLISVPEHATPKRAQAYLVTDEGAARTVACFGPHRPQLDDISRNALNGTSR
jgi:S-DNA-T family DNA segregation ATPase FtsK/SpoIIIE